MGEILIGTSGYSYKDWIGPIYPEGTKQSDYLSIYADKFRFTELNFAYYKQPEPKALSRMVENTPEHFRFSIKGHQSLTHTVERRWKDAAKTYREGIEPLISSKKLAAVLLQFPFSFHYTKPNREYLSELCDELKDLPLALEFRGRDWQRETVQEELRRRDLSLVCVDTPNLRELPQAQAVATSDLAYIRFHGRNRQAWWNGDNTSRYDYLYSPLELNSWLERIVALMKRTTLLLVAFNNHYKGQAVQNAQELANLLNTSELIMAGE